MKSSELMPSYENLLQSFLNNTIGRNGDVWDFCRILDGIEGRFSIAIDSSWGSGKTFFIKQSKMLLDALNPNIVINDSTHKDSIIRTCNRISNGYHVELQPQVCVYYDAWKNDNDVDPIISIVYSILTEMDTNFHFSSESKIFSIALAIADCVTGKNIKAIFDSTKTSSIFDSIHSEKSLEGEISDFLDSLLLEKGQRLIVFVDELDRCKPTYAVQVLERIKHYFCNDRITFVFSINAKELEHTISNYYCTDFDSGRYLDRFFDLRIDLPKPNESSFYRSIGFNDSRYWFDAICDAFIKTYNLSMREQIRYFDATKPVKDYANAQVFYSTGMGEAKTKILPIMIGLKMRSALLYEQFISGKDSMPLIEVAKNAPSGCFNFLLSKGESYAEDEILADGKSSILLENRLDDYYKAIFAPQFPQKGSHCIQIGAIDIMDNTAEVLKYAASGLKFYEDKESKVYG